MYRVGSQGRTQAIFRVAFLFLPCFPYTHGRNRPMNTCSFDKSLDEEDINVFPAWWCRPHPHASPPPFRNEMWNNDNETINDIITTLITLLHLFYLINPTFAFISFSLSPTPAIVSVNSAPITVTFGSSGHALVSSPSWPYEGEGQGATGALLCISFYYLFIYLLYCCCWLCYWCLLV